jgi:hypothetical protein
LCPTLLLQVVDESVVCGGSRENTEVGRRASVIGAAVALSVAILDKEVSRCHHSKSLLSSSHCRSVRVSQTCPHIRNSIERPHVIHSHRVQKGFLGQNDESVTTNQDELGRARDALKHKLGARARSDCFIWVVALYFRPHTLTVASKNVVSPHFVVSREERTIAREVKEGVTQNVTATTGTRSRTGPEWISLGPGVCPQVVSPHVVVVLGSDRVEVVGVVHTAKDDNVVGGRMVHATRKGTRGGSSLVLLVTTEQSPSAGGCIKNVQAVVEDVVTKVECLLLIKTAKET